MKAFHVPRVAATLALLAGFSAAPAFGMSVSYYLDQSNINAAPYADGQNYLQVTISDNVNGNIDFTVQTLAPLSSHAGTNYGIDSFGFNTALGISAANIAGPSGWGVQTAQNQDGFGNFIAVVNGTGNNRVDPLHFSITNISGDTPTDYLQLSSGNAREGNVYFAAHVAGLNTQVTSGYFGGSAPVPEADTWAMMIVGLGLVGISLRGRKKGAHPVQA